MRLGYNKKLVLPAALSDILRELERNNLEGSSIESSFDYSESSDGLVQGEYDAFIFPLHLIPFSRNKETKIWALCERQYFNNLLLIKKDTAEKSERIPIRKNDTVWAGKEFLPQNLTEIRPDIDFEIKTLGDLLDGLSKGELSAAVAPQQLITMEVLESYLSMNLNEREFGHAPGQGAYAIIAKKETVYGLQLRGLHHIETAFACNVERKIALELGMDANLHVELDQDGSYHVWFNHIHDEVLKKIHFSQSTRVGIMKKLIDLIKN